jgi:hypothetical protein
MQKKIFSNSSLLFSFLLHFLIIFSCSFYIKGSFSPSVYLWPNIVNKKDLFSQKTQVIFPPETLLSLNSLRKKYFSSPYLGYDSFVTVKTEDTFSFPSLITKQSQGVSNLSQGRRSHVYLWKKKPIFSSESEEAVSFKTCVSGYGKILFLYPEELPVDSYANLYLQEYIRKAAYFIDDKFFWTKLEGVVK